VWRSTPIRVSPSSSAISAGLAPTRHLKRGTRQHDSGDEQQHAKQVKTERYFIHAGVR